MRRFTVQDWIRLGRGSARDAIKGWLDTHGVQLVVEVNETPTGVAVRCLVEPPPALVDIGEVYAEGDSHTIEVVGDDFPWPAPGVAL